MDGRMKSKRLLERNTINHVKYKPCQTHMVADDRQPVFAFRNEIFKQIENKIRNNYE